jgi:branched-chain amino acid aminotransferase
MNTPIYFVNDRFVPASEASLPVTDLGIMRGYAVFESIRTYGGKPFRLDEHLVRLEKSADRVGLSLPRSRAQLAEVILDTLARNEFAEATIRVIVTGGESENFFTPTGKPSLIVIATPLRPYPQAYYQQGVKIATAEMERCLPEAKTTAYILGEMALRQARSHDPEIVEVLYVDRHGRVTECIMSNFFAFFDDVLVTPREDILYGVTRQAVLKLAEPLFQVEVRDVLLSELQNASEMFITASVKEIMPVTELDGVAVGKGGYGPNTRTLMDAFREMADRFAKE